MKKPAEIRRMVRRGYQSESIKRRYKKHMEEDGHASQVYIYIYKRFRNPNGDWKESCRNMPVGNVQSAGR